MPGIAALGFLPRDKKNAPIFIAQECQAPDSTRRLNVCSGSGHGDPGPTGGKGKLAEKVPAPRITVGNQPSPGWEEGLSGIGSLACSYGVSPIPNETSATPEGKSNFKHPQNTHKGSS